MKDTLKKAMQTTAVSLSIDHPRDRKGCDLCRQDVPTEQFRGFLGHVLWVCLPCFKDTTTWTEEYQLAQDPNRES